MQVGEKLGGNVGWEVVDAKFMRGRKPILEWKDYVVRAVILLVQMIISVLDFLLETKKTTMPTGKTKNL